MDTELTVDVYRLARDAEHYADMKDVEVVEYRRRLAAILDRIVEATGDESSRWIASDAHSDADRAERWAASADGIPDL